MDAMSQRTFRRKSLLTLGVLLALLSGLIADAGSGWQLLAPGMELKRLKPRTPNSTSDSPIIILRIDPNLWELEFVGVGTTHEMAGHTARVWCQLHGLTAATNAGMFDTDGKTHLGYLRYREQALNKNQNQYQSVAAFDPRDPERLPGFHIFDLDAQETKLESVVKDYASAVQNLRLIKRPGLNQWGRQGKKWSEAALGEDSSGRILFIFSRAPFSMHDLNQELLSAGIGLVAAQHLEGGPEAQLYVQAGSAELEMFGSYETSFKQDDSNAIAWPVPNILGVRPRTTANVH